MYLKKIIISGFKSFADRVVITLDQGITGIVGPNGSGKSNVIDAVRWVMGEQNARNLRGEKATDIIFSGSERRKPLSMAEVSLVFDNSDFDPNCPPEYRQESEIALARRLYADGGREYLINKKPCRLKDIVEFFAMTGLGGRSYSMIQQGQVERILNAKPEDIREILEEAAGTTVYKKRKHEALKKLDATRLNLSRVEDILVELERQKASLQDQVEKARKYQDRSERLKDDELSLLAHNHTTFSGKVKELQSIIAGETDKEVENLAAISHYEARRAQLQGELDKADPELQKLQEVISTLREQIASREAMLKSATQTQEHGKKRLEELTSEVGEDDANLKVLESQVDSANEELAAAEKIKEELQSKMEAIQDEVDRTQESTQVFGSKIEDYDNEIRNLERMIESNRMRQENITRDLDKNAELIQTEQDRVVILAEETAELEKGLNEHGGKLSTMQSGLDGDIREKHEREQRIAVLYEEQKTCNNARDEYREKYHEARARVQSLEEIEDGATDVASTVAELREAEPETNCHSGLLAGFVKFRDTIDELSPKAKSAFERWCERLVVESLDHLNELTSAVGRHQLATIPVVLLEKVSPPDSVAKSWAENRDAIPFSDFVSFDDAPEGVRNLLARTYYLPTLRLDTDLTDCPEGVVIFTSQGVSFSHNEEYAVGAKHQKGLLSRRSEIDALTASYKTIENELAAQQARIDETNSQINESRQIVAEIDQKLQAQNREVVDLASHVQALQEQFKHKSTGLEQARNLLNELDTTQQKLTKDREELSLSGDSLIEELEGTRVEVSRLREENEQLVERREEVVKQHSGLQLDLAKSEARAGALKDSFLSNRAQLELMQNKLSRRYEEQTRVEADIEKAAAELIMARDGIEELVLEREKLEGELQEKRDANSGLVSELRAVEGKLKECSDSQSKSAKLMSDRNLELERAKIALEGTIEQANEKYQLDIAEFEYEHQDDFDASKYSRRVSNLRAKIESMGPINMMAINEFDDLMEREDFIRRQQEEVLASIDLLETAIAEIEASSEQKFATVFETINLEFGKLFPILFPKGEGCLELTNPENPLEGGVEIICRLPGKARKSMSLFSGGEKALTAISLIFALLKTKPTPFCFLDEVDAPLDEANVGRYNRVLMALSDQFQFILITHNRRTMEVLDTLYGITMQEPGVSKVVGVDMQKDLPTHLRKAFHDNKAGATAN